MSKFNPQDREAMAELLRMQSLADQTRTRLTDFLRSGGWEQVYHATQWLGSIRQMDFEAVPSGGAGMATFLYDAMYLGLVEMLSQTGIESMQAEDDDEEA